MLREFQMHSPSHVHATCMHGHHSARVASSCLSSALVSSASSSPMANLTKNNEDDSGHPFDGARLLDFAILRPYL